MKCLKLHWLSAGLLLLLVASSVPAQNNDEDRKGKGGKGQGGKQSNQYPQSRRPSSSPYPNWQFDNGNRSGGKENQTRNRDDSQSNDRNTHTAPKENQGDLKNKDNPKNLDTPEKGSANRPKDANSPQKDTVNRPKESDIHQNSSPNHEKDVNTRDKQPLKQGQPQQANKEPARNVPAPKLTTRETRGGLEKVTSSGQVREKTVKKSDGEHTQYTGATGRVQREVVRKSDGTEQATQYAAIGKDDRRVVTQKYGSR